MKKILPILHAVLLLVSLLSPLWADWKIVVIGFAVYILQKVIFKGCLLSFAEFGRENGKPKMHFTPYYLKKFFGLKATERMVMRFLDYIVAPLVPIVAILIQIVFHYRPLIKI